MTTREKPGHAARRLLRGGPRGLDPRPAMCQEFERMPIEWDPSYETGNTSIDLQHRKLLATVGMLETAERDGVDTHGAILLVLDDVMEFTLSHFVMEEELMLEVAYPADARDEMVEQHREFTSYARLRVIEFSRGELTSVMPLQTFLADWLTVHEFGLDKAFAEYLRQRDAETPVPEADSGPSA
jgi:hemerythrin